MAPDTLIGRFRLVAPLPGEGDRWQAQAINDEASVHLQLFELSQGPTAFLETARRLMAIDDPHVQGVLDASTHGGRGYLVTPASAGLDLARRLAQGPPPYKLAIDIGVSVLRGLAVAHASGLAHGAIRAETVLWADGRVQLAGLGQALLAGRNPTARDDLKAVAELLRELAPDAPGELRALISAPPPTADAFCRALKTVDPALGQDADFDFSTGPTPMPPSPTPGLAAALTDDSWGVMPAAARAGGEATAVSVEPPGGASSWGAPPSAVAPAAAKATPAASPRVGPAASPRVGPADPAVAAAAIQPPAAAHSDAEESWGVAAPIAASGPPRPGKSWMVSARSMVESSAEERAEETWGVRPGKDQTQGVGSQVATAGPAVHAIGPGGAHQPRPARSPLSVIAPIIALLVVGLIGARWYLESRDDGEAVPEPTVPQGLVAIDESSGEPSKAAEAAEPSAVVEPGAGPSAPAVAADGSARAMGAAGESAGAVPAPDVPRVELRIDPVPAKVVRVEDKAVVCSAATECRVPIDIDYEVSAKGYVSQTVTGDDLYDRRRIGRMRVVLTREAKPEPRSRKRKRR